MEPNGAVKRVELERDRWVEVRRVSVGDVSVSREHAHERGWEDGELDAIFLLPRLIANTSAGAVTQEFVDGLTESEYARIWLTAKGADVPNPSSPSSAGTSKGAKKGRTSG